MVTFLPPPGKPSCPLSLNLDSIAEAVCARLALVLALKMPLLDQFVDGLIKLSDLFVAAETYHSQNVGMPLAGHKTAEPAGLTARATMVELCKPISLLVSMRLSVVNFSSPTSGTTRLVTPAHCFVAELRSVSRNSTARRIVPESNTFRS